MLAASDKNFVHPENSSGGGSVSTGSILVGVLFVGIAIFRLARVSSGNGNIFVILGIFTAIGIAIYYFTKKK